MANNKGSSNSVIFISDPNSVNINNNIPNAIAQYQDMHITAELSAVRKGRSVIVQGHGLISEGEVEINFIGSNQNKDDDNYLNFTTNYYDGSVSSGKVNYESFGITNIKVSINSSYIPQVNIQFVDIRGLSFFNQENSPYRILFDFPPPVFNLKIKGYYGKTLEYNLHLVKYTTEFKSENGNFVIDGQFTALTFAPLADILLRYVINAALIDEDVSKLSSKRDEPPINTYDFILKLKGLYQAAKNKVEGSYESKEYEIQQDIISNIDDTISLLDDYKNNLIELGNPLAFIADVSYSSDRKLGDKPISRAVAPITVLNRIREYNPKIGLFYTEESKQNRLYVGHLYNPVTVVSDISKLDAYKKRLTSNLTIGITSSDVKNPEIISGHTESWVIDDVSANANYIGIDVTEFYIKLIKKREESVKKLNELGIELNLLVNSIIDSHLGMRPTIYNVFRLILNDVDTFFKKLRKVSEDAEGHHKRFKSSIVGSVVEGDGNGEIYAFPLVTDIRNNGCVQNEVRVSPKNISDRLSEGFPELDFVLKFMQSFTKQQTMFINDDMKSQQNTDGSNRWIPISPIDSVLVNQTADSPYHNLNAESGSMMQTLVRRMLNRFYIISQYSIPVDFYDSKISDNYIEYYASIEASNVLLTLNDFKNARALELECKKYNSLDKIGAFYQYLEDNIAEIPEYKVLKDDNYINNVNEWVCGFKDNDDYIGSIIYDEPVSPQDTSSLDSDNPLSKFVANNDKKWYQIFKRRLPEGMFGFSSENILFLRDLKENDVNSIGGDSPETRFLANRIDILGNSSLLSNVKKTRILEINKFLESGNEHFNTFGKYVKPNSNSNRFGEISDIWISQMIASDVKILEFINNENISDDSKALLVLSNFGFTLSPFNIYPHNLLVNVFETPSIVEVPFYLPVYLGALLKVIDEGNEQELIDLFSNDMNLKSAGYLIFADMYDIQKNISKKDKLEYLTAYNRFKSTAGDNGYNNLMTNIRSLILENKDKKSDEKVKAYNNAFDSTNSRFKSILLPLIRRTNIIVNGQESFTKYRDKFYTLEAKNKIDDNKIYHDKYFAKFFEVLLSNIGKKTNEIVQRDRTNRNLNTDEDIMNQLYYSFKNINDKWLTNPVSNKTNSSGYPYNIEGKSLIDSFVFVDRAMNNIDDTIINPEILMEMFDDPNINIFSVLSQLLSMNHFEFFPLQNFIFHNNESWTDTFKLDPLGVATKREAFVCMYIGGTSSYPTNIRGNGFENDGIEDISTTNALDFSNCNELNDNNQSNNVIDKTKFDYKKVFAFRVLFGQQNQSMFKDIKIDSKEYPETNESIAILARIAGDENNSAPSPKGQNLYNLYENRAYSATVTGLGNAMIQPTQYFQLDNIPLFNGAYLILSVEHDITPNHMITSFTGTKILKYPTPRVMHSSVGMSFEGSTGDILRSVASAVMSYPNPNLLPPSSTEFNAPIDPKRVTQVWSYYDLRDDLHGFHLGVDFSAPKGVPIWAVYDGLITSIGDRNNGYGNMITIEHTIANKKIFTAYAHLNSFEDLTVGQKVSAGDPIGTCGSSGGNYGNHLHFEIRIGVNADNAGNTIYTVNPKPYLLKAMPHVWKDEYYKKPKGEKVKS